MKRTPMALGIPSPQLNQQSLYRHSTRLPSILHQFAGHFRHAPLSLMYITPVRRSSFRMRSCLSWLARQPDTSEPHATPSPASIAYVLQQLVHKLSFIVSGYCRYATTLHGQCRGRMASQHQHSRDSEALHSGETVRELLTHSDNDPLHRTPIFFPVALFPELRHLPPLLM